MIGEKYLADYILLIKLQHVSKLKILANYTDQQMIRSKKKDHGIVSLKIGVFY